jgi:hypothetical protein
MSEGIQKRIRAANQEAVRRMMAGDPVLVDVAPAGEVIPGLQEKMVLHAGPPIKWQHMCGAQRGAVLGMLLFEGWAHNEKEALDLMESGQVALDSCHNHQTVGAMAGTISPSMWVYVVENQAFGNRAYSRFCQDRPQFGDYSPEALRDIEQFRDTWGPSLRAGIRKMGGVRLKPILARALQMGDELHNRNTAASSLLTNALVIPMLEAGVDPKALISTLHYLNAHELFFLGIGMGAAKSIADTAQGIEYSTIVTAMARNGVEFGIRVSGLGEEWFAAPSPCARGLLLPGYREDDMGADMGDSAITETVGWGGLALAGAPTILSLIGGSPEEAIRFTLEMREITQATSIELLIPALGFEGISVGINIEKVIETNIVPVITTGIAHREPGHPVIGSGLVHAPIECFSKALLRFADSYLENEEVLK